tara:strand:- start:36 stop:326 length:291 start_codon:yes stop_codon:yes gene_type:complete
VETITIVILCDDRQKTTATVSGLNLSPDAQKEATTISGVNFSAGPQGRTQTTGEDITGGMVGSLSGDCETETTGTMDIPGMQFRGLGGRTDDRGGA